MRKSGLLTTLLVGSLLLTGCSFKHKTYNANSWREIIDKDCMHFFDGCNECDRISTNGAICTAQKCETYQKPICKSHTPTRINEIN